MCAVAKKSWESVEEDDKGNIVTRNLYNADKVDTHTYVDYKLRCAFNLIFESYYVIIIE